MIVYCVMKKIITTKEMDRLKLHVLEDISYREQGTFNISTPGGDYEFNEREAKAVTRTLAKVIAIVESLSKAGI